jgi:hypothetical protein
MEKDVNKALDNFVNDENTTENQKIQQAKKVVLDEREGLIERVDKIHVTRDGRQLLREQY